MIALREAPSADHPAPVARRNRDSKDRGNTRIQLSCLIAFKPGAAGTSSRVNYLNRAIKNMQASGIPDQITMVGAFAMASEKPRDDNWPAASGIGGLTGIAPAANPINR
jgi:hypothetical protein